MLKVTDLCISYGKHQALQDVSMEVGKGELVVILGANGAGKSSLLRAIAGLCEGEVSGRISLSGESITDRNPDEIVHRGVTLVPEGRAIFADLNVDENLKLGAYTARARAKIRENLALVHELFPRLRERARQVVRTMSGGEQQMVAVGRALMSAPDILMLDEPSLGLSPILSKNLFQSLAKIRDAGLGVLVVEQNAKLSLSVADRGYLIEVGRLVGEDSARNLAGDPAVQSAYLGEVGKTVSTAPARRTSAVDTDGGFVSPTGLASRPPEVPFADRADLADLVARAGEVARRRPRMPLPERSDAVGSRTGYPSAPVAAGTAAPESRPAPRSAAIADLKEAENRVTSLIRELEEAADRARSAAVVQAPGPPPEKSLETDEALPVIQVIRKSEVRKFKRDRHGALVPVGNLQQGGR